MVWQEWCGSGVEWQEPADTLQYALVCGHAYISMRTRIYSYAEIRIREAEAGMACRDAPAYEDTYLVVCASMRTHI